MENITTVQDDRLLDYLDGKLEGDRLHQLKQEMESSKILQQRLEVLRSVHRVLATAKLESPSPTFVSKVMQNLNAVSFSSPLSPKNGILLLAGVMVAASILVVMLSAGIFDQLTGVISLERVPPVQKYLPQALPPFSINGKLIIKILVGLNLVLGFIVLDRTVLKPFFLRRAGMQL